MYKMITYWLQNYAEMGTTEQRAVHDFMECETKEMVNSLRNELIGLIQNMPEEEMLDKVIGIKRKVRYNSYEEWAKTMLMWLASYKS